MHGRCTALKLNATLARPSPFSIRLRTVRPLISHSVHRPCSTTYSYVAAKVAAQGRARTAAATTASANHRLALGSLRAPRNSTAAAAVRILRLFQHHAATDQNRKHHLHPQGCVFARAKVAFHNLHIPGQKVSASAHSWVSARVDHAIPSRPFGYDQV